MFRTSYIEINKSAYQKNLKFLKSQIGAKTRFSSVIKGNAYGHGLEVFAPMAQACGVDHFSVFSADEAQRIKPFLNKDTDLLIMGDVYGTGLEWSVENGVEFFVFDFGRLHDAITIAKKLKIPAKIHIELETGMNRTGFESAEYPGLAEILKYSAEHVQLSGICTHFAGAESLSNFLRVKKQIKIFKEAVSWFEGQGFIFRYKHACCSAAVMRFPEMHLDLVRVGIMQYGFWPSGEVFAEFAMNQDDPKDPLRRLINWRSHVMSIKDIEPGQYVGYGSSFIAHKGMRIAIVPVGYSQGFSRSLSNHGRVVVGNQRENVVGIVNMNSISVDISQSPEIKPGDEVVLIGRQGDAELSVASFSEFSDLMNYEILTRLPVLIPRIVVED
ncbi:MAG: alanine racemase [Cyclobacteriaceae bacterium]|nr:alanine racemase [Cyclobacteriaceae bacterium]